MMKLKPNQTQVGPVVITRQKDNTFRCVDSNGSGIATIGTYAEAVKVASSHNSTNALVRLVGKDKAIEMLRSGYKV